MRTLLEQREHEILAPYAAFSDESRGRLHEQEELETDVRTCYQRDTDRIVHCKAFRRLMHKTQVFLQPEGDHYRTRMTHTLEVSRIARAMARALHLNEDLAEAGAMGHDLGHTPFGHAGEGALSECLGYEFRHNEQSLRVVDLLENGGEGLNLLNTYWPLIILSIGALGFKNGLYIFMLRQFFKGVPDELEESAYIDGSGVFHTFFTIILPLSVPMMITVFLFAFSWQWTDDFYTGLFFTQNSDIILMPKIVGIPNSLTTDYAGQNLYYSAIRNTCGIMIILPLVIMYVFLQRYLVEGIERSGLTAE